MTRNQQRPLRRTRGQPSGNSTIFLGALVCLVALGMLGGGYGLYASGLLAAPPRLDKETFCRRDVPITHTSLMLIDLTDPFNQTEIERVKARARNVAVSMPDYGLLVVAVLDPDNAESPRVVFRRCAPRSPTRTSNASAGEQVLRAEWNKKFEGPLLAAIADATSSKLSAARSLIIATITALTQRADFDSSVKERELIVVSDLLEFNPKGYSQMAGGDLVGMFRRSSLAQVWPDLKGVPVTIEYVQRPEPPFARAQSPAQRDFWLWWFKTGGASRVEFFGVREPPPLQPLVPKRAAVPAMRPAAPRGVVRNPYNCGG